MVTAGRRGEQGRTTPGPCGTQTYPIAPTASHNAPQMGRIAQQGPQSLPLFVGAANVAHTEAVALLVCQATAHVHRATMAALTPLAEGRISDTSERTFGHGPRRRLIQRPC